MAKKLWGGRFKEKIDKDFFDFQKSIDYDYKLAEYDIYHSIIHVFALGRAKILAGKECSVLVKALLDILGEIVGNKFKPSRESEDIHTEIQNRVEKKVGKLALKLHTLRSRNDQIVFDEKLYCHREASLVSDLLDGLVSTLKYLQNKYNGYSWVGYTHTQRAQQIAFKDYLAAFSYMFMRDKSRLIDFRKKSTALIGSGAFKGTILTKEYDMAIKDFLKIPKKIVLELASVINAPDNVSDRDFVIEFLSTLSILQMHLSRLAEDFILYSTKEFNYLDLPEEFCTGSSLMPHKKNPDFLELVRGYTGPIYGNLISLLTTMKGLPLTYNRDMQLDKGPLFSSVDIIKDELRIMARFIKNIKVNKEAIDNALNDETLYATELAEILVLKGIPFKEAHTVMGKIVRYSQDNNIKIKDMPDSLLKTFCSKLNQKGIKHILN
ncbi:MAG: argininosuccinate lyase [Candidatus Omnitrophota bacterium]